jgi:hypothetical protein
MMSASERTLALTSEACWLGDVPPPMPIDLIVEQAARPTRVATPQSIRADRE